MTAIRLSLLAAVVATFGAACVTTQIVKGGPDPRAGRVVTPPEPAPVGAPFSGPTFVEQRSDKDPIVNVRIVFQAGSADDPVGKEGLTGLTARLMAEATADLSAADLTDALFPMAAELSVQVDKETTVFVGRVHRDHERKLLKVLTDVVTRPRLEAADFKRLRDEQLAAVVSSLRTGNDEALQREALEVMLFGAERVGTSSTTTTGKPARHPYGHTPNGTATGLAAITLDDIFAHRDRVFTKDRAVVGVGGGASDDAVSALKAMIDSLPATGAPRVPAPRPAPATTAKMLIVEKPSAGTAISLGFPLTELDRAHPDYPALKLAETYFGEHRNLIGHLFHSMREVRGLNYGDYAYVEHFVEQPGTTFERLNIPRAAQYFSMWIRPVEHKNRVFATRMAAWELRTFIEQGIATDEAFERTKSFVMGYWASKEQEPMRRLGYAVDAVLTAQPFDRDGLRERVRALSRADVNAAIARHLKAGGWRYVVVTEDAAPFVAAITTGTSSPMTYATPPPPEVLAEDKAIDTEALGLSAADIVVVPPTAVFER